MPKAYTTFEAGKLCGVYPTTVINWVNLGRLKAYTTPGGHRRIYREDLIGFLEKHRMPVPRELSNERQRILIVDSDVSFADLLRRAFSAQAALFEPQLFPSRTLALVEVGRRPPQLLVFEAGESVPQALEMCSAFQSDEATRSIRLIATSARKLSRAKRKAMEGCVDAFYLKPVEVGKIVHRATQLLKR
ncbi:MAG: helix-turn-helix domain-containing protein [Elusimicrobia bacterium]|nr:helix-turn-helix domain-containing protein [Elusimicrobiota bacterium]